MRENRRAAELWLGYTNEFIKIFPSDQEVLIGVYVEPVVTLDYIDSSRLGCTTERKPVSKQ